VASILPENLEPLTVAGMSTGDTAYTAPWAMWVDTNRRTRIATAHGADAPGLPRAYEVEFSDSDGVTLAIVVLEQSDIEVTWRYRGKEEGRPQGR
jgi:hypothetical protein